MPTTTISGMQPAYIKLAAKRSSKAWPPYLQPEDFGYDFREWVSPYTKTAHATGGIALVLQDWASVDGLKKGFDPEIQRHGRIPGLLTNRRLDETLRRVFDLQISETYVTNAFPFIKPGGMSAAIPTRDVVDAIRRFTKLELSLARPTVVFALGSLTHRSLSRAGVDSVHVPHPAARGLSLDAHERAWQVAIQNSRIQITDIR